MAGGAAAVLAVAYAALLPAPATAAPSTGAVIAEVYGGGGNSGATLTNDFIELGNRGAAAVSLAGWSVQYLPAVPSAASQWQVTPLTGSVAAGGRYLVQEAAGSGGTTPLPTPDATGSIAMGGTAGTVALVNTTTALTCKTAADCAADARIVDLVGYGTTAVVREGTPTGNLSNTTSASRNGTPLTDTDVNSADFTVGAPSPVNSGGGGDPEPPDPTPGPHRVHDVQGNTRLSPLAGQNVTNVPGIVTAVRAFGSSRGYWIIDPAPDADPATSEGLFVFTGSITPAVAVGDSVVVSGRVTEFYPLASGETVATTSNQSITEITQPATIVVSSGNPVPAAEELTPDTVPTAYTPTAGGGSIESLVLQPSVYALDFYESREGMPLRVTDARVVGPTDGFNALWVTSKPNQNRSARGATVYTSYDDPNSGRLKIESLIPFAQRPFPVADVNDSLAGVTEGPLDYSRFGGYVLQATTLGELVDGGLERQFAARNSANRLAIATYNVENLAFTNDAAKFNRLALGVVAYLGSPDIVALEEIQDNNGATNNGVVAADQTLQRFVDAIVLAGGPRYQWRQIDPVDGEDGGQPGGNIRVGFLFNPSRVQFVDRPGGDATTAVGVTGSGAATALTISPGRIDPANPAWEDSRKPLVGEFVFNGKTVFVAAVHFASKGGDQALHGRFQPPNRVSEIQRLAQAHATHEFWHQLQDANRLANFVLLGDVNDFQFSPVTNTLVGSGGEMTTLHDLLQETERYSYVFDGNAQVLDQILVSRGVRNPDFDVVRINAEFADQASDHDPSIVRFVPR
ncbi:MAG TPA: endonuclease/exonuclease/phosphatase family protein [Pseudonocardiaceae bacterium]